ncbi:integrase core domain-containing protein [Phthorimaea operculella]|nr:integrase core domain-containing protein [Phthorimaea operculella]
MRESIALFINACEACKKMKYERKPIKPHIQLTQTQNMPFQEIFMDLLFIENNHYLTLVDAFSKFAQAIYIPNRSTPEIVKALIKYFSLYGKPGKINSDPGAEFKNELVAELLMMYKIDQHIGTPSHPNSMAIVERFHSTIIEVYRLAANEHNQLDAVSVMTYVIMAYNNSIHSATDCTPFEVVFGHTDLDSVFKVDREKHLKQQLIQDHRKRMKYLYEHISEKLIENKVKVRSKLGGEEPPEIKSGDIIFAKDTRTRKAKHLPRYEKVIVTGEVDRNIIPVKMKNRDTKVAIKNIKRPPQMADADAGPSHPHKRRRNKQNRNEQGCSGTKNRDSDDEVWQMGDN